LVRALTGSVLVASLVAIPVAAGASPRKAQTTTTVNVKLLEFKVKPKPVSAESGTVPFQVKNFGGEEPELVVVKADAATADSG